MRHEPSILLATSLLLLTGCSISKNSRGDSENVKVETPFGGLRVNTDDPNILASIGLPAYPGATVVRKDKINGQDKGSADVNLSFGSFQLKVKATEYRTDDDPQKVFAFYKKALGRYGTVIQCSNDKPVGTPSRTTEGLTCDDDHRSGSDSHIKIDTNNAHDSNSAFNGSAKVQLKAGSKKHQHIVDINPDSGGARFGLVSLDLPVDFSFGDKDDKDDKLKQR